MKKGLWAVLCILLVGLVGGGLWYGTRESADQEAEPEDASLAESETPPNVVVFTLDTTRADHLGAYGYPDIQTPTIDGLAKAGVLFRRAITAAPITLPSHSSIMTGLYPPAHGVRDNGTFALAPEVTTLAEVLHTDGYATGAFVGAAVLEGRYGLAQGFDVYNEDFSQGRRRPLFMYAERPCGQVVSAALAWMEQKKSSPFFAWLHFYDPHAGYDPPEPWATQYDKRPYDGEIAYADHCIGTVMEALRNWGVENDTVVVITADHGESLGEHGEKTHGLFIYDATVHVPLIFHAPGRLPAARSVDAVVSTVDIFPTLLTLLGKSLPAAVDGKSLLPLMRGRREQESRTAYSETLLPKYHYGWAELKSVTTHAWKLIDAPQSELYDLVQDPRELINVYEREHRKSRSLKKTLTSIAERTGAPESRLALDPETAERLRGLGYVWMPPAGEGQGGENPPDPKDMLYTHEHVQQGREFFRQDRFDEAIGEFQQVVKANPKSISTYFDLAASYLEKEEMDNARQTLATALNLDPQNARAYSMVGAVENLVGNQEEAFKQWQRAIEVNPRYVDAYVYTAALREQRGELEQAEETIRKVLQFAPTHSDVLSRLGSILLAKGDVAGAETQLREALKSDPYDAPTHRVLGVLHDRAGRVDEALREYREALKSNNRLADVHNSIGVILAKQGKLDQAEVQTKEALRINPKFVNALISLAVIYDQKGLKEKALETNTRAVELDPKAYQAYGNLAVAAIREKQYAKAEELLRKALAVQPEYPEAYNNLAVAYMEQGQLQQAITAAEQAVQQRPEYPEALTNLGVLHNKLGQHEKALIYHQRATAVKADYWEAHNNLAATLAQLGRYAEAAAEFTKALQTQPQAADVHKRLGDLYFGPLKEWEKARQHYEIFLRLTPPGPQRKEVLARLLKIAQS
ncbi:MAG: tetratricopeptide repeat protein [Deltaproteobacteria bacterium]|nr:tetratricopeptide repeat protein [Deltaproteobacteria bacterium]